MLCSDSNLRKPYMTELENQSHVQKPMLTEALEAASKHGDLDLVCFLCWSKKDSCTVVIWWLLI